MLVFKAKRVISIGKVVVKAFDFADQEDQTRRVKGISVKAIITAQSADGVVATIEVKPDLKEDEGTTEQRAAQVEEKLNAFKKAGLSDFKDYGDKPFEFPIKMKVAANAVKLAA